MDGSVAQITALTCHGNAAISGIAIPRFFPSNSTCKFCARVDFRLRPVRGGMQNEYGVAETPDHWFSSLKQSGCIGILLVRRTDNLSGLPDRTSAGLVGGGGTWMMEVLGNDGWSDLWVAGWELGDKEASDRRVWTVTYERVVKQRSTERRQPDLNSVMRRLEAALEAIHGFAAKHSASPFTGLFENALALLRAKGGARQVFHEDLAPDAFLEPRARILLDACQPAWVFGAMGSWNDMYFEKTEEQESYDHLSEELFQAVTGAIQAAANSSCPVRG